MWFFWLVRVKPTIERARVCIGEKTETKDENRKKKSLDSIPAKTLSYEKWPHQYPPSILSLHTSADCSQQSW